MRASFPLIHVQGFCNFHIAKYDIINLWRNKLCKSLNSSSQKIKIVFGIWISILQILREQYNYEKMTRLAKMVINILNFTNFYTLLCIKMIL